MDLTTSKMTGQTVSSTVNGLLSVDRDLYHDDLSRISHSMLEVFRERRLAFRETFVTKTMPRKTFDGAFEGAALHDLLLRGIDYFSGKYYCLMQKVDRRTKAGKAIAAEASAANEGKLEIGAETLGLLTACGVLAFQDSLVSRFLDSGTTKETAFGWSHSTGLHLRCCPDIFLTMGGRNTMVDFKLMESSSPAAFARAIRDYGYHRQAAFYADGLSRAIGFDTEDFFFVVFGKKPPFEMRVYRLKDSAIVQGRQENEADLQDLADCLDFDLWQTRANGQIEDIGLPEWK